jgi:hypothetical protein
MATRTARTARPTPAKPAGKPREEEPISPTPLARQPPAADEIRLRASLRWEAAGRPPGDGINFWLEAEQDLLQGK